MRHSNRFILAAILAAGVVAAAAVPSSAFDSTQLKCRSTVAKSGGKYTKAALKSMTSCHKNRDKDGSLSATDCNSIDQADTAGKVDDAATKFSSSVIDKCVGVVPSDVLYQECPAPCATEVPSISTFADVAQCLTCLANENTQAFSDAANGTPTSPVPNEAVADCHAAIIKNDSKLFNSVVKIVNKCQAAAEKEGGETVTDCTVTNFASLTTDALDKCAAAVSSGCAAMEGNLPSAALGGCGGSEANVFGLTACVCGAAQTSAQELVTQLLDLSIQGPTTTTTTTTTTTVPGLDPRCPSVGELVLYSRDSNIGCATNDDCVLPRTCDTGLGMCRTLTSLDTGWAGAGHNSDINDNVLTRARLECHGTGPVCGECNVVGIDPSPGNCRCANNTRNICDKPFLTDDVHCTGTGSHVCDCYFGAPFPLVSGGTPVCIVNRFSSDVTGTANVDLGTGSITANLRSKVFLGIVVRSPCPTCAGKCSNNTAQACDVSSECGAGTCVFDTPDDGIRDGLCKGTGNNTGASCDATGQNASLPAQVGQTGGGAYSLDCFPLDPGKNVSGSGLKISLVQSTGSSSLASGLDCDAGGVGTDLCPCLMCTKDVTQPCRSDAECTDQGGFCSLYQSTIFPCTTDPDCDHLNLGTCGALTQKCTKATTKDCTSNADCDDEQGGSCLPSTCTAIGSQYSTYPKPNKCADGICTGIGGEKGECAAGPNLLFCDGILKADGSGLFACSTDFDCSADNIGLNGGLCTLSETRPCFLDPINASGTPDPQYPVGAATFCIGPVSNPGINGVAGLPGPGRAVNQAASATFCASDPNVQYQPGVGGCPVP